MTTFNSNELVSVEDDEAGYEDEYVGEGRFLASFFFPLFPQYWPIDLGDNLNNLKSPKTVARFVYRDITSVRRIIHWIRISKMLILIGSGKAADSDGKYCF